MAGNLSLEASIRTCKIDPAYAAKVQSDRFLNPHNMVCPIWNGYESAGRPACSDSFNTKNAGCNSAEDRIFVENYQRPQYVEYVNLSSGGIHGEFYGPSSMSTMNQWSRMKGVSDLNAVNNISGNYGLQFGSTVYPNCGVNAYTRGMQQNADSLRKVSAYNQAYKSNYMKNMSGCGV
jgi:hypothetical protein